MTEEKRRERALKLANVVSKTEGVKTTEEAEKIFKEWEQGKITGEEMKEKILQLHKKD